MNGRNFPISLNAFEAGMLTAVIWNAGERNRRALGNVFKQLRALGEQVQRENGVIREELGGNLIRLTDKDGNVIIRSAHPWEKEE